MEKKKKKYIDLFAYAYRIRMIVLSAQHTNYEVK